MWLPYLKCSDPLPETHLFFYFVSWVWCGAWLYGFLIFALFLILITDRRPTHSTTRKRHRTQTHNHDNQNIEKVISSSSSSSKNRTTKQGPTTTPTHYESYNERWINSNRITTLERQQPAPPGEGVWLKYILLAVYLP